MSYVLPLVGLLLLFALFALASGSGFIMVLFPVVLFGSLAAAFISYVLQDGRRAPSRSVRHLPTNHLQRQMYLALRPRRPKRPKTQDPEEEGRSQGGPSAGG